MILGWCRGGPRRLLCVLYETLDDTCADTEAPGQDLEATVQRERDELVSLSPSVSC